MSNNVSNQQVSYYEQDNQTSIERAILAEDLQVNTIDNTTGKFFLPVMTPTNDISAAATDNNNGKYSTSNYITLIIPGYIIFQFMSPTISDDGTLKLSSATIPKGTVFLVEFLGGEFTIQRTCIVGLLTSDL